MPVNPRGESSNTTFLNSFIITSLRGCRRGRILHKVHSLLDLPLELAYHAIKPGLLKRVQLASGQDLGNSRRSKQDLGCEVWAVRDNLGGD